MSNNSRIAKNTIFLYVRMLLIMGVTLYTSRVILLALGETDFGIYNVVGGLALMFGFFSSSLSNALQRFLNLALGRQEVEEARRVFSLGFTSFLNLSLIVLLVGEILGVWLIQEKLVLPPERRAAALWVFHATMVALFLTINTIPYSSVLIARENFKVYAYVGLVEASFRLFIAIILMYADSDKLRLYALLYTLSTLLINLFYAVYCMRRYPECRPTFYWNTALFKEISQFIGWNLVGTAVYALNSQGLSILLNMFFGVSVNAARGVSDQVDVAVSNVNLGFMTAVKPQAVKLYATGEKDGFIKLLFDSSRYSYFLVLLLGLPLLVVREEVLRLWLHDVPTFAGDFVFWTILIVGVNAINNPIWNAVQAIGTLRRYIIVGNIVYVLAFPLSFLGLYLCEHPTLPLIVLLGVRSVYIYVTLIILRRYMSFSLADYIKLVMLPIGLVTLLSIPAVYLLYSFISPQNILTMVLFGVSTIIAISTIIYGGGLQTADRKAVYRKIKTACSKK